MNKLTAGPTVIGAVLEQLHVGAVNGEEWQRSTAGHLGGLGKIVSPLGTLKKTRGP